MCAANKMNFLKIGGQVRWIGGQVRWIGGQVRWIDGQVRWIGGQVRWTFWKSSKRDDIFDIRASEMGSINHLKRMIKMQYLSL